MGDVRGRQRLADTMTDPVIRGRADPVWWIETVLGVKLWSRQAEIVEAIRDHHKVAVRSCHGIGKSFVCACIVLWFLYHHLRSIVITTAPTDRQVRGILWKEIRALHARAAYPLGGVLLTQRLELDADWYAWGFKSSDYDPDRFQGFHAEDLLLIADEACGIAPAVWDGFEGILSSANAREMRIGNPTDGTGEFAKSFKRRAFAKFRVSAYDSPNLTTLGITEDDIASGAWADKARGVELPAPWLVTPQWVADRYEAWGPGSPLYVAKVLGDFPTESEDQMIPMAWLEAAQARELEIADDEPVSIGLDVAREGDDDTADYKRRGGWSRRAFVLQGNPLTQTAGRTAKLADELTEGGLEVAAINVDAVGIGAGVYDMLAEDGYPAVAVGFGETPEPEPGPDREDVRRKAARKKYANLKAQLYWHVRERYRAGQMDIDPDDDQLIAEATSIRWFVNRKGQIAIEPKDKMKARGVKSPDLFEAQVYSFADEVLGHRQGFALI